jgi:hypothetical protein
MGNNLRTGSKKPKNLDRQRASGQLPPLPKMYQMGIDKGRELERERIIKLLEEDADANYYALRLIKGENK